MERLGILLGSGGIPSQISLYETAIVLLKSWIKSTEDRELLRYEHYNSDVKLHLLVHFTGDLN